MDTVQFIPTYAKFYNCNICKRKIHEDYIISPDFDKCDKCYEKFDVSDYNTNINKNSNNNDNSCTLNYEEFIYLLFAYYIFS